MQPPKLISFFTSSSRPDSRGEPGRLCSRLQRPDQLFPDDMCPTRSSLFRLSRCAELWYGCCHSGNAWSRVRYFPRLLAWKSGPVLERRQCRVGTSKELASGALPFGLLVAMASKRNDPFKIGENTCFGQSS